MRASLTTVLTALPLGATLLLGGCGDVRQGLGFEKKAPDEFAVVSRAPLSLPPDYTLRPPQPGAPRPNAISPRVRAEQALLQDEDTGSAYMIQGSTMVLANQVSPTANLPRGESLGTAALLAQAGALTATPGVRQSVDAETERLMRQQRDPLRRLMFWRDDPEGTIVDPAAERARIQGNLAAGRPVTAGETPMIERREKALLEGIFN